MTFNYFAQLIKSAFRALNAARRRSLLTMLGIIIGVAAVIIIIAIGAGAQSLILSQVSTFGANLVGVLPGKSEKNGPPASVMGVTITTLTLDDAKALADKSNASSYFSSSTVYSWCWNTYVEGSKI
ncbi:ABC transporter permease [Candidatus Falkowbacteria bacterium]|nr:MAG: ABC transporter permease [Candidatus Falkowbacteria bacterium]